VWVVSMQLENGRPMRSRGRLGCEVNVLNADRCPERVKLVHCT
jgi:hypothetical protein